MKIKKLNQSISEVQVILTVVFVCALIISNIISSRIFNFFGFSMTSAVMIFPITYVLSDVFSEIYGYRYSRLTCYLAFGVNFCAVLIFWLVSFLPVHPYGVEAAEAFKTILLGSFACTMASFIAFVAGDFVNDRIFAKMKKKHEGLTNHKGFMGRAILSSLAGEFFDSAIYLPLAFLVFNPIMKVKDVAIMVVMQVVLKTSYEIVVFPITNIVAKKVGKYEEKFNTEIAE